MKKEGIKMKKGMKRAIVSALVVCLLAGTAFANSYYLHADEEKTEENVLKIEEGDLSSVSQNELVDAELASVSMNGIVDELTYQDENVLVTVTSEVEGAIPEGVTLSVTPILPDEADTQEQYAEVEAQLEAKAEGETYDIAGFLAYDICFIDEEGNKIEPNGAVKVSMEYINATIPEEVVEKTAETEENVVVDVTVMHLEEDESGAVQEVVDMAQTDSQATGNVIENLETNEAQEVQKAEFITESFSIFTITWTKETVINPLYVQVVDMDGNPLGNQNIPIVIDWGTLKNGDNIDKTWIHDRVKNQLGSAIDGYGLAGMILGEYNGREVFFNEDAEWLKAISFNDVWWYDYGRGWYKWDVINAMPDVVPTIYLVYDKLTTIETLDTSNIGITMRMIDYSTYGQDVLRNAQDKSFGGGDNSDNNGPYNGNIKFGILQRVLGADGYPVSAQVDNDNGIAGISMAPLFSGELYRNPNRENAYVVSSTDANHLFSKSEYEETGYYSYSSFENFAYLGNDGNFTVYEQLGTPRSEDKFYYKRGNFMPYNQIVAGAFSEYRNLYHGDGSKISTEEARYNERLYLTQGTNYWFGMYLDANFYQPADGKVTHNGVTSDMVYTFNGDDDLWIYVDNVLLLDIGGIHDAHSGAIDFATGVITWSDCKTGEEPQDYYTTIKEQFRLAGIFPDGSKWDDSKVDNYFKGNTFKDFSTHTMKMFYMERGAGASNLHMKFNLQVIPKKAVDVKKVLTGDDAGRYNDKQFAFQMMVKPEGASAYEVFNPGNGTLITSAGERKELTVKDNVFYLKNGETAQFSNLAENTNYYVVELDLNSAQFAEPTFNNAAGTKTDNDYHSTEAKVGERSSVTVTNTCITGDLAIVKDMAGDGADKQTSVDAFNFEVTMMETTDTAFKAYNGKYTITRAADGKEEEFTTTDGKITGVNVGDSVAIKGVLNGTVFNVSEVSLDNKYITQDPQKATIGANSTVTITFTNEYKASVKVSKEWNDVKAANEHEAIYVGLYLQTVTADGTTVVPWTPGEGDVANNAVLNKDNGWSHTFEYVPVLKEGQSYVVKELRQVKDGETAEFTIGEYGYIGVADDETVLVGDRNYTVAYSEPTQSLGDEKQEIEEYTISNTVNWQIVKRSTSAEGKVVSDAEFSLKTEGTVFTGKSDANGVVQWTDANGNAVTTIPDGTYTLQETKAPKGFMLNTEVWTIVVNKGVPTVTSSAGDVTQAIEGNVLTFTFINTMMYTLPATGGIGVFWYAAGGMLLLFAAMLLTYKSKCNGNPA